jgi:hypothetical protein
MEPSPVKREQPYDIPPTTIWVHRDEFNDDVLHCTLCDSTSGSLLIIQHCIGCRYYVPPDDFMNPREVFTNLYYHKLVSLKIPPIFVEPPISLQTSRPFPPVQAFPKSVRTKNHYQLKPKYHNRMPLRAQNRGKHKRHR